jgi:hypothetical protein
MAVEGSNVNNVGTAAPRSPAGGYAETEASFARLDSRGRLSLRYVRSNGRVRHVGPPEPLIQISDPGNVRTSKPASRMI